MSYEGDKYEYKFLVFSILNEQKNMIDNQNEEDDEDLTLVFIVQEYVKGKSLYEKAYE